LFCLRVDSGPPSWASTTMSSRAWGEAHDTRKGARRLHDGRPNLSHRPVFELGAAD
jgi:hypothetical protein